MDTLARYTDILHAIQRICSMAHIAGGAVRDTILERPIKDIDLFLTDNAADEAAQLLRSAFGYVKVGEWRQYEGFSDPLVSRVAKFEKADETIPLCLIAVKNHDVEYDTEYSARDMKSNVERFDFGICMAAWDGGTIYKAPQFQADLRRQTFTLHRADNNAQFAYSMSRFQKLTADRYAGWTLKVPSEFESLARDYTFRKVWVPSDFCGTPNYFACVGPQLLTPKDR